MTNLCVTDEWINDSKIQYNVVDDILKDEIKCKTCDGLKIIGIVDEDNGISWDESCPDCQEKI